MKRIRLLNAKAENQTETANAASSELGPLVCYTTAQVFTGPPSWTVPGTDACSNSNPHARCETSTQSRLQWCSICPMQEGWPSDWIRLRFSVDGCNIFYVTRRVRGDSPSMDPLEVQQIRARNGGKTNTTSASSRLRWQTPKNNSQTSRHSLCSYRLSRATCRLRGRSRP